ncbi:MAG: HDOD domain-containing protein, partial [Spirochaetes bacterium]|nr:HDOD domain-containing protein [Spirochaetota bacterium]
DIIENIPVLPESIQKLKERIEDPEYTIEEISDLILKDTALTADILMMANSPFYRKSTQFTSMEDCVKVLGTAGLQSILMVTSSYRLLAGKVSQERLQSLIKHSEETAYYARELTKKKSSQYKLEEIYLASLLHDIGKVIVEELNTDIYSKIQKTMALHEIPIEVLEDLAEGINHAQIGSMIAEKWNYPAIVCEVIRCHHNPREAQSSPEAVFNIYLANTITYYQRNEITFENIDHNALEFLNIQSQEELDQIVTELSLQYNNSIN